MATEDLQTDAAARGGAGERYHIVKRGDTLSHIAQHYYGWAALYHRIVEANPDILFDSHRLKAGQRLVIP